MSNILAFSKDTEIQKMPAANSKQRERVVAACKAMTRENGWDDYKLRAALDKRGIYAQPYFPDSGLELTLHLPMKHYKKKDFYRIFILLKLHPKATHFDAALIVQIAHGWETCSLHKPIKVPVVTTLKAQVEEVMRAYHALYHGVFNVVGVENLPGWPGDDGLQRMNDKVVLQAKQVLNQLPRIELREFGSVFAPQKHNRRQENIIQLKRED